MPGDMTFSVRVLHEHEMTSPDTAHLAVARFKFDRTIQPNGKNSPGRGMPTRFPDAGGDMDKANQGSWISC